MLHVGVVARGVVAVPILTIRSVAVVTFVLIRIGPAQPGAPPRATKGRDHNQGAAAEAMMMEPLAVKSVSVKFAVGKPVSMKFAVVKPAVGKSSKAPVKSARPTVKPAARKSATSVKPTPVSSRAALNSSAAM